MPSRSAPPRRRARVTPARKTARAMRRPRPLSGLDARSLRPASARGGRLLPLAVERERGGEARQVLIHLKVEDHLILLNLHILCDHLQKKKSGGSEGGRRQGAGGHAAEGCARWGVSCRGPGTGFGGDSSHLVDLAADSCHCLLIETRPVVCQYYLEARRRRITRAAPAPASREGGRRVGVRGWVGRNRAVLHRARTPRRDASRARAGGANRLLSDESPSRNDPIQSISPMAGTAARGARGAAATRAAPGCGSTSASPSEAASSVSTATPRIFMLADRGNKSVGRVCRWGDGRPLPKSACTEAQVEVQALTNQPLDPPRLPPALGPLGADRRVHLSLSRAGYSLRSPRAPTAQISRPRAQSRAQSSSFPVSWRRRASKYR